MQLNLLASENFSLNGAGDIREYGVGVCTDQSNGAHDNDQNYGYHHGVFSNVLTGIL